MQSSVSSCLFFCSSRSPLSLSLLLVRPLIFSPRPFLVFQSLFSLFLFPFFSEREYIQGLPSRWLKSSTNERESSLREPSAGSWLARASTLAESRYVPQESQVGTRNRRPTAVPFALWLHNVYPLLVPLRVKYCVTTRTHIHLST